MYRIDQYTLEPIENTIFASFRKLEAMPTELRSRKLPPSDDDEDDVVDLMASYVTVEDASSVPADDSSSRAREQKKGLDGDGGNVLVLLFLYILQGRSHR